MSINNESEPKGTFPARIYTCAEVESARVLIEKGYRHHLKIFGGQSFKEKTRRALELVKTAGGYGFFRTYVRAIREIDGLSQLREAEATIWANVYTVQDPVDAACFLIHKAWQMKAYIEGEAYYGHIGETKAVGVKLRFLETLREKSRDPKIREESRKRMRAWDQSKFL